MLLQLELTYPAVYGAVIGGRDAEVLTHLDAKYCMLAKYFSIRLELKCSHSNPFHLFCACVAGTCFFAVCEVNLLSG